MGGAAAPGGGGGQKAAHAFRVRLLLSTPKLEGPPEADGDCVTDEARARTEGSADGWFCRPWPGLC